MKVEVLLFGQLRDLTGAAREIVVVETGATLDDLFRLLGSRHGPEVARHLQNAQGLIVMINGQHVGALGGAATVLDDRDSVAILPAVVGG